MGFVRLGEEGEHGVAELFDFLCFLRCEIGCFCFHDGPFHHAFDEREGQKGQLLFESLLAVKHFEEIAAADVAHVSGEGAGVGEDEPCDDVWVAGGDDLRDDAAQGLAHEPDFFVQMVQELGHSVCKCSIVFKGDLVVKGEDGEIFGKAGEVLVEKVGEADAACEQHQGGRCVRIFVIAVVKGFSAVDGERGGRVGLSKFLKRHRGLLCWWYDDQQGTV